MSVVLNHAVAIATSPLSVAMLALAAGCLCLFSGRTRIGRLLALGVFAWIWALSAGVTHRVLGRHLEGRFPPVAVESFPAADAIVVLGGGVGATTDGCPYPELFAAADRVAQAARLWKAGKAPVILTSGVNEANASLPLLTEFGVPRSAVVVENASRNTEENARFVLRTLVARGAKSPRILLVTSSWHMRRALLMFGKYAPQVAVVPAAADYEATLMAARPVEFKDFLPCAEALDRNTYLIKEVVGYWGYRLLRR